MSVNSEKPMCPASSSTHARDQGCGECCVSMRESSSQGHGFLEEVVSKLEVSWQL